MIIIAIPNIIQLKGLVSLVHETDVSCKIDYTDKEDQVTELFSKHHPSVVYIHSSFMHLLKSVDLDKQQVRVVRVINEKPPSLTEENTTFEILYMDDTESSVKRNIKRNIALSSKRDVSHPKENSLSDREKSVVREIALGRTNKEIADNLFISAHTVITHRKNITRKLGVKTVSGLTVYAILNKLIQMEEM